MLIAGPTASGKSAVALRHAERRGGMVINADSMQVYAELAVLTARPGPDETARAPHRLYGHVPMERAYSVGQWLADAAAALEAARRAERLPIFVGGTGLYYKALIEGLSPMPPVPADIRQAVRARLASEGAAALHGVLAKADPDSAARVPPTDSQRILRALEILEATGRPLSHWRRRRREGALIDPARAERLALWPDRAALRARIDARVDAMLGAGALEEARAVMALGLDPALPGYRAHGLRPLIAHLKGEISLDEAAERTRAETRRYAKRQITWLRRQMADWPRVDPGEALA